MTQTGFASPGDLQVAYKAWPTRVVAQAVHTVLYGLSGSVETIVISDLVGRWMTGESEFAPPPLPRSVLTAIRRELNRHVN